MGGVPSSYACLDGKTPMYAACYGGGVEVVRYLCEQGRGGPRGAKAAHDAPDNHGWTPFLAACYGGHLPVVRPPPPV
jgi:ankyrin repeat protein